MKRSWALFVCTLAYSFLFYRQHAGLNLLIFDLIYTSYILTRRNLTRDMPYILCLAGIFVSAFAVLVHGSSLALWANILSLSCLSALSSQSGRTFLLNLLTAAFSLASSPYFVIQDLIRRKKVNTSGNADILAYVISLLVILAFFVLYQQANPLFEKFTAALNLKFVTVEWLLFSLGGLLISYAIIYPRRIERADELEQDLEKRIESKEHGTISSEVLLFLLTGMNLLLLVINLLDLRFLYAGAKLPEGITQKQFVHNGVDLLVLSIILGISVILYSFTRISETYRHRQFFIALIYLWLAQNFMMIASTAIRNHNYIEEALLTYKRIGVFFWLLLAAGGLTATAVRVRKMKRNWYLVRFVSTLAFCLLIVASMFDWDAVISKYNLRNCRYLAGVDKKYLISLSEYNLPYLQLLKNDPQFQVDSSYHYHYNRRYSNRASLDYKLLEYLNAQSDVDWRSFNFRDKWLMELLPRLSITSLDISYHYRLEGLAFLPDLKEIKIATYGLDSVLAMEINQFPNIRVLKFDSLPPKYTAHLRHFKYVERVFVERKNWEVKQFKQKYPEVSFEIH